MTMTTSRTIDRSVDGIRAELAQIAGLSAAHARTMPPEFYTSPNFLKLEQDHLLRRQWMCVGHVGEVPKPGDYFTTELLDEPLLVVRDATALTASITGGSIGLGEDIFTLDAPLDDATTASVFTQELRFSGEGDNLAWVVGGFYSTMDRDYAQSLLVAGFEDATGIPTAGDFGAAKDVLFFSGLEYEFEQFALFGEAALDVSDQLSLTAGLRFCDFTETRIEPQVLSEVVKSVQSGLLSWESFVGILSSSALLPDGVTADEEARRLLSGIPGGLAAPGGDLAGEDDEPLDLPDEGDAD